MNNPGRYQMRTIARMTGFSPAVLRAWESRHDLLEPVRTDGGHRLYTDADLLVLRRVQELLTAGSSIGEIAALGRQELLRSALAPVPPVVRESSGDEGQLQRLRELLVGAAVAIDQASMERGLDETFVLVSADVAIHQVIQPAARTIGELWLAGKCSVAGEHLASSSMGHRLRKFVETARPASPAAPRVLCACFPDEHHELGLLIVAYHLGRLGHHVTYLGASLPLDDLEKGCQKVCPRAVFLSVMRTELYDRYAPDLSALAQRRHETVFFVGGCGLPHPAGEMPFRFWPAERPLSLLDGVLRGL